MYLLRPCLAKNKKFMYLSLAKQKATPTQTYLMFFIQNYQLFLFVNFHYTIKENKKNSFKLCYLREVGGIIVIHLGVFVFLLVLFLFHLN